MNERIFGRLLVMQRIKTFTRFNAFAAFKTVHTHTRLHHTHTHRHTHTHTHAHTHAPVTHTYVSVRDTGYYTVVSMVIVMVRQVER